MSVLEFTDVWRFFGPRAALAGVSLRLDGPGVYGLVGRNGAGKTTLLRLVPCLLHPASGAVRVFGLDPWEHQEEVKQRLGYLAEDDAYPRLLRGRDLLEAHAALHRRWDRELVDRLVARFQLNLDLALAALSKGQRRQVGLLCAIGHRPELLVLDEPAGGLDPVARREMLQAVVELLADSGATVIFSSHQFADIERLAARVGILHEGVLLADEPLAQLRENSCRALVAADEAAAARLREAPECLRLAAREGGWQATLRLPPAEAAAFVRQKTGAAAAQVLPLDLEELFVDWTGGGA